MTLPLEDVRVIAIEQFGAGPWATMQLADLGAEVVKLEDPHARGDVGRYVRRTRSRRTPCSSRRSIATSTASRSICALRGPGVLDGVFGDVPDPRDARPEVAAAGADDA